MGFELRKLYVWLISLAAVLAIYLLYNQLSETPQIDITRAEPTGTVVDSDISRFGSEIGMIGDVGVGTVEVAKFITLNKDKEVEREFGFKKLLHDMGDEWEIEKPFMNVFRSNFKCYLTADRGMVEVETAVGRPSPKDATLTGNVVIHILPEDGSDIRESFIYLDDVVFISEESQFSTAGPVKFISEDAQMLGTGMELVYNDELDRLELLRIIRLESLRLKTLKASSKASLFSQKRRASRRPFKAPELSSGQIGVGSPADTSSRVKTERPAESIAADVPQKASGGPAASQEVVEQAEGELYRCVFSENVVINSPEQLIFADEVFINDIFLRKASDNKTGKADASGADRPKVFAGVTEGSVSPVQSKVDTVSANDVKAHSVPVASRSRPDEQRDKRDKEHLRTQSPEQFVDIVVTCDNGIVITPMDSPRAPKNSAKLMPGAVVDKSRNAKSLNDSTGRPTFFARRIDYSSSTGDSVASGPSELTFYVDDLMDSETKGAAVPVNITAQEKTTFLQRLNQVVFEGDVLCVMLREKPNFQQKYTLSAPRLTVDLSKDKQSEADIEHLTASGQVVQLDTSKRAGEELLGFTKLKCLKFDYDAGRQMFLATGPGIIAVDNSKIAEPEREVGKFSLQRPCYAVVRSFDTLKYFSEANRIIADARREQILIDYFPIVQGQYGQQVSAAASHIEALLYETAGGRAELSTLAATGGISYKEKDIQFEGSEFFYDNQKSIITAWGSEFQPCLLNGALVDAIEYDLKTGKVKTKITGPGALQMKR